MNPSKLLSSQVLIIFATMALSVWASNYWVASILSYPADAMIGLIPVMLDACPDNDRGSQRSLSHKTERSG